MSDLSIVDNHGLGEEDGIRGPLHCVQSPESTVNNFSADACPKPMINSGTRNGSIQRHEPVLIYIDDYLDDSGKKRPMRIDLIVVKSETISTVRPKGSSAITRKEMEATTIFSIEDKPDDCDVTIVIGKWLDSNGDSNGKGSLLLCRHYNVWKNGRVPNPVDIDALYKSVSCVTENNDIVRRCTSSSVHFSASSMRFSISRQLLRTNLSHLSVTIKHVAFVLWPKQGK